METTQLTLFGDLLKQYLCSGPYPHFRRLEGGEKT